MIYHKVTKHKQAGINGCLHCNDTNIGAWTGSQNIRYTNREMKIKKSLRFHIQT